MQIYLRTRGKSRDLDYKWLDKSPPEEWWQPYSRICKFDDRSILVAASEKSFRIFLSGIPSSRKDQHNTAIRFTLSIEAATQEEFREIFPIITVWLSEIKTGAESTVGDFLDRSFPGESIDSILSGASTIENGRIKSAVLHFAGKCSSDIVFKKPKFLSWVGDIRSKNSCSYFLGSINDFATGKTGLALYGNFVENIQDAEAIPSQNYDCLAVLAQLDPPVENIAELKKKAAPQTIPTHPERRPPLGLHKLLPAIILFLIAITALIFIVILIMATTQGQQNTTLLQKIPPKGIVPPGSATNLLNPLQIKQPLPQKTQTKQDRTTY